MLKELQSADHGLPRFLGRVATSQRPTDRSGLLFERGGMACVQRLLEPAEAESLAVGVRDRFLDNLIELEVPGGLVRRVCVFQIVLDQDEQLGRSAALFKTRDDQL